MKTITETTTRYQDVIQHAIDKLSGYDELEYASDLHHKLFNTDYFIIGYAKAEDWLSKGSGIFNAIEKIKEYEQDNFGEVTTDFSSSETVANMYAYILGEEILSNCATLQNNWNGALNESDIQAIIEELKEQL